MTENLDLNLSTGTKLTTSNTDIPVDWTPTRSTLTNTTGWTDDDNTPYSYDPGNRCWNGTITGTYYSISSATIAKDCSKHDSSHYHVGNYYNWTSVVAMNNTSSYTTDKTNVNQSICPKGWQLPVYTGNKSFAYLNNTVTSAGGKFTARSSGTIHKAPFYFPYSGYFTGGTSGNVGHDGTFWSSVVLSNRSAHTFSFDDIGLNPQGYSYRYLGRSVRCVARTGGTEDISGPKTINDISTMQQWGNLPKANRDAIKTSMATNTQYELKDERDQRMYYVSKLADGNIWMTENLDLALSSSKTLTPNDTDIKTNWTPTRGTLTTTTGWTDDYNTPYSYDPGNRCWNGAIVSDGSDKTVIDATVTSTCNTPHDSSHNYIGNYYNWTAAIAMNDSSSLTSGSSDQSICPKGWQLPRVSGAKSFINLKNAVTNAEGIFTAGASGTIHQAPFYLSYAGHYYGSSHNVGRNGAFWSGTTRNSGQAYQFAFDYNGDLEPQFSYYYRNNGFSIRCVARDE